MRHDLIYDFIKSFDGISSKTDEIWGTLTAEEKDVVRRMVQYAEKRNMAVKKKSELLDDFDKLCNETPADERATNAQINALKQEIMDRKLTVKEQGRFQAILANSNLA